MSVSAATPEFTGPDDPAFVQEMLPILIDAAVGRTYGRSWEDLAAEIGVPVAMLETLPTLMPDAWDKCMKARPTERRET